MLLGRIGDTDFSDRYPEVEGQLKLLHNAITRAMHRLFFAEASSSLAGDAFVRWLTTRSIPKSGKITTSLLSTTEPLGTRCLLADVETLQGTPDDWRSIGFDNVLVVESREDMDDDTVAFLKKAIFVPERPATQSWEARLVCIAQESCYVCVCLRPE